MDTENQRLRLSIDGRWTAAEMAASLQEFNFLYDLRLYLNSIEDAGPYWNELYHFFPPLRHWAKRHGYSLSFYFPHGPFLYRPEDVRQYSKLYFSEHVLQISRIEYASPGVKDFLGIGEILKQVRLFVQFLIQLRQQREKQNLENAAQRIQNARDFVKLRIEFARGNAEIENINNDGLAVLVDDNTRNILKLIEEKKITSADMLESEIERTDE